MRAGPYELLGKIGEGGMGTVHRAQAPGGAVVALKLLRRAAGAERFARERRLLETLGPEAGFVPILDAGETPAGPYLVMPLLEGGTLRGQLGSPWPTERAVAVGRFLAAALGRAHVQGIVHRDLKPENVLLDARGAFFVADLGLAKHWDRESPAAANSVSLSRGGEMRGTAGYMAPEQMRDAKGVGPAADVFAIGAILYEGLTGEPAFSAENLIALLAKVEQGSHRPLRSVRPDVPDWLAAVVERALDRDPSARFQDGAELLRALETRSGAARSSRVALVPAALLAGAAALVIGVALSRSGSPAASPGGGASDRAAGLLAGAAAVATEGGPPGWLLAIPEKERAALPAGVRPSATPGEWVNEKDGTVLVRVPGGKFTVGPRGDTHERWLPTFFIAKLEVTNEQFARFVRATGHVTRAEDAGGGFVANGHVPSLASGYELLAGTSWRDPEHEGSPAPAEPVTQVSWLDAKAYCDWAGLVIPTDEEWEKAASWDPAPGRARRFSWGDDPAAPGSPRFANLADRTYRVKYGIAFTDPMYDDGVAKRAPVGSFPLDRSPCGALDMGGNVTEWCRLGGGATADMQRQHGGCWCGNPEWAEAATNIGPALAFLAAQWLGFRAALELPVR